MNLDPGVVDDLRERHQIERVVRRLDAQQAFADGRDTAAQAFRSRGGGLPLIGPALMSVVAKHGLDGDGDEVHKVHRGTKRGRPSTADRLRDELTLRLATMDANQLRRLHGYVDCLSNSVPAPPQGDRIGSTKKEKRRSRGGRG